MGEEMRAYFFANSALSGIQKGLQVAHCVAEMARLAATETDWCKHGATAVMDKRMAPNKMYADWASLHKTIVVLDGGFHANLREICNFFDPFEYEGEWPEGSILPQNTFPWASFTEDVETMNRMMTCVGIILPERIYEAASAVRERRIDIDHPHFSLHVELEETEEYTKWEVELIKLLNSRSLAR
jgi:hypothetical protein